MTSPAHGNTPTDPGTNAASSATPQQTVVANVAPFRGAFVLPPPTDRYELGEEIARGGMGAVHRARDRNLDRELALKVLLERFAHNPPVIARFVEEALIGGQLQHPNLVPVHEVGMLSDGRPFIALKLIKGETLSTILARRKTPAEDLTRRLGEFKQVCEAVGYAHEHRIVHRDLKPSNVMVGRHGEVQVMDWGVAKHLSDAKPEPPPAPEAPAPITEITAHRADGFGSDTQAGDVLGTPSYMPPEQARGVVAAVDERSDVFGLGAILCELLTGQPPYPGPTRDASRVLSLVADMVPVHARLDACGADPALVALAKRCLDPDPANRPPNGTAVAGEIDDYLTGVQERLEEAEVARAAAQVRAAEERKRRRVQLALLAAVFGILVACGAGFVLVREQRAARAEQTVRLATEALGRMESLRDQASAAAIDDPAQRDRAAALWADALAAAEQVESVSADGRFAQPVAELRAKAAEAERHRKMLAALEAAHEGKAEIDDADFDRVLTAKAPRVPFFFSYNGLPRYERAFREYGIDVDALSVEAAAGRVSASPIAERLTAALDDWYMVRADAPRAPKLLAIAGRADADPVRKRVRAAVARDDRAALQELAAAHPDLPPTTALLLAYGLEEFKDLTRSMAVLDRTVRKHPNDFWVQNALFLYRAHADPPRYEASAAAALAALALRPTSHVALAGAADALTSVGRNEEAIEYGRRAVAARPDLAYPHIKLFQAYAAAGREQDVAELAERAAARFPDSFPCSVCLGAVRASAGRLDEAESILRAALKRYPDYAPLHVALATVLATRGRPDEAEAALRRAEDLGGPPWQHADVGHVYFRLGKLDAAVKAYRRTTELAPGHAAAWSALARALLLGGRHREAVEAGRAAVRANPADRFAHIALAQALRLTGQGEEALKHALTAGRLLPTDPHAHTEIGHCREALRQYAEAEKAYRDALDLSPADADAGLGLVRMLRGKNDIRAAVETACRVVAWHPDSAEGQWQLGAVLQLSYQREAAEVAYRAACRLDPKSAVAHNDLGTLLERLGRDEEALAAYKAAAELDPPDAMIHRNYGVMLIRRGHKKEGEAVLRAALARPRPNAEVAHRALFEFLYSEGQPRRYDALAVALTWTGAHPNSAAAYNAVGNALWAAGGAEQSVAAYRRAVELVPNDPVLNDNLGGALGGTRRFDEAAEAHRRAWRLAPTSGYYAGRYIRALTAAGRLDEAQKVAGSVLEGLPHDPHVHAAVAALRWTQKDLAGAEVESRAAVELAPKVLDLRAELGRVLMALGRPVEAAAEYRRVVEDGGSAAAGPLAGALVSAGDPAGAVRVATEHLASRPNTFALLGFRGHARLDLRETGRAISDLTEALRAAEGRTDIPVADRALTHLWLAQAQYLAGRFPEALASARTAERLAAGTDLATTAAHLAANAADALRFEARYDAVTGGTFRPTAPAERAALAGYLAAADREPALAYELFVEALDADPKLAEERNELHRYNAGRAALRAAAAHAFDSSEALAGRARAFAWLSAEWAATAAGSRPRRAGVWLRDPAFAPVRDTDPSAFTSAEWLAWRSFWDELGRALELPPRR